MLKKVIRNKATRAFFSAGNWTTDIEAAEKFTDMVSVLQVQKQYQITDAEVVLLMGEQPSMYDVAIPLNGETSGSTEREERLRAEGAA